MQEGDPADFPRRAATGRKTAPAAAPAAAAAADVTRPANPGEQRQEISRRRPLSATVGQRPASAREEPVEERTRRRAVPFVRRREARVRRVNRQQGPFGEGRRRRRRRRRGRRGGRDRDNLGGTAHQWRCGEPCEAPQVDRFGQPDEIDTTPHEEPRSLPVQPGPCPRSRSNAASTPVWSLKAERGTSRPRHGKKPPPFQHRPKTVRGRRIRRSPPRKAGGRGHFDRTGSALRHCHDRSEAIGPRNRTTPRKIPLVQIIAFTVSYGATPVERNSLRVAMSCRCASAGIRA